MKQSDLCVISLWMLRIDQCDKEIEHVANFVHLHNYVEYIVKTLVHLYYNILVLHVSLAQNFELVVIFCASF